MCAHAQDRRAKVAHLADLLSARTSSRRKAGASGSCSRHASLAIVVIRSRRPSVPARSTATAHTDAHAGMRARSNVYAGMRARTHARRAQQRCCGANTVPLSPARQDIHLRRDGKRAFGGVKCPLGVNAMAPARRRTVSTLVPLLLPPASALRGNRALYVVSHAHRCQHWLVRRSGAAIGSSGTRATTNAR